MTMLVISNEVRDLSLLPFSKEHTTVAKALIERARHALPLQIVLRRSKIVSPQRCCSAKPQRKLGLSRAKLAKAAKVRD